MGPELIVAVRSAIGTDPGAEAVIESGIIRTVVLREHATNDILVDLDAKGVRDLLRDAQLAEFGVAEFHLQDCRDELRVRTIRAGLAGMGRGRQKQAVFAIDQGSVEPE